MIEPGGISDLSAVLGGGGIGVVWGWCAVYPFRHARRPGRSLLALAGLAALSSAAVWWVGGGWPATIAFAGAAAAAGWLHAAWLHQLRTSFIPKEPR
jgi:hypothetical protein